MEINSIIGDIYDASENDDNWLAVGKSLFAHLGADAGSLRLQAGGGKSVNVFETRAENDHTSSITFSSIQSEPPYPA